MRGSHLATFGRRRTGTSAMAMAAVFLFSIGATLAAPVARAADSVTVSGNGTVLPFPGSGQPTQSFDVNATDDGAGNVTGLLTVQTRQPYFSGNVRCIYVNGNDTVIRASAPDVAPAAGCWATLYVHEGGPSGDSVYIDWAGPSGSPTCPTTPAPAGPFPVSTGGITVTIVPGATGPLSVTGNGTFQSQSGAPTRVIHRGRQQGRGGHGHGLLHPRRGTSFSASCLYVQGANAIMTGTNTTVSRWCGRRCMSTTAVRAATPLRSMALSWAERRPVRPIHRLAVSLPSRTAA